MNTTTTTDTAGMLAAIHADPLVGRDSCSVLAECFTDELLVELLALEKLTTPAAAVIAAHELEMLYAGQALDHRWGEDTDPELLHYRRLEQQTSDARAELEYWHQVAELAPTITREAADIYRLNDDPVADAADFWTASQQYALEDADRHEREPAITPDGATITAATITADRFQIFWDEIEEYGLDALAAESERIVIEHKDGTTDVVEVESLSDVGERWRTHTDGDAHEALETVTVTYWGGFGSKLTVAYIDSTDAVFLVN